MTHEEAEAERFSCLTASVEPALRALPARAPSGRVSAPAPTLPVLHSESAQLWKLKEKHHRRSQEHRALHYLQGTTEPRIRKKRQVTWLERSALEWIGRWPCRQGARGDRTERGHRGSRSEHTRKQKHFCKERTDESKNLDVSRNMTHGPEWKEELMTESVLSISMQLWKCNLRGTPWTTAEGLPFESSHALTFPSQRPSVALYCLLSLVIKVFYNLTPSYLISPIIACDAQNWATSISPEMPFPPLNSQFPLLKMPFVQYLLSYNFTILRAYNKCPLLHEYSLTDSSWRPSHADICRTQSAPLWETSGVYCAR